MLIRKHNIEVKISPGFPVLLAIAFYLDDGNGIMGWGLLAALIHELGHVLSCTVLGGKIERLSLSMVGAELKFGYPAIISYSRENFVLIAGATANLLSGILAYHFHMYWFAILSFGLGAFNLFPILPLDGGRIMLNLISIHFGPELADKILSIISGIFIGLLLGIGCVLAIKHANFMIAGLSIWLLIGIITRKYNFSPNK